MGRLNREDLKTKASFPAPRDKEQAIKGPGLKLDLDVRRCFECPACGRRIKRQGDVTTYQCHCQEPPVWMHLREPPRPNREYHPYIVPEIQADELIGTEDVPTPAENLPEEIGAPAEAALAEEHLEAPVEEEFYSPEDDIQETPMTVEEPVPNLPEPAPDEPPTPQVETAELTAQEPPPSMEQQPRPGKSKRRRGRKRNRGGKPGGDAG
jgi:hypothetical protein